MKKTLLLIYCVGICLQSLAQQTASVLMEDFEDGNSQNLLGGSWYTFHDNTEGGKSRLKQDPWQKAFVKKGGYASPGMLQVEVTLEQGSYKWRPYYAFATNVERSGALNPASFAGISYWHKGIAHRVEIMTPEVTDYDYYQALIPASEEWKLVTIDFSLLTQEGWGRPVALNLDQAFHVVWKLNETSGLFQLDDVRLVKEISYVKQNNMEILPAEIPDAIAIHGNVSSPLNDLSKKYLTKGMNLTNWAEQDKITSSDPRDWKYNEAFIRLQANQGLRGIRFPIDLDLYLVDREKVLRGSAKHIAVEPMLYTLLDSMNSWTKRYGLSYTIDYHAYDGTYNRKASKDPKFREAMASLWGLVARHFVKEQRPDLFFELTNEPGLSLPDGEHIDQEDWTLLAGLMIDAIRKEDQTRPVIFGDTKWYSLDELVNNKPFKDRYVIYSFHMYDPFLFTHQGASWAKMSTVKDIPFPYTASRWSTEWRTFGITETTPDWVKGQAAEYYRQGNKQHIKNRLAKVKNWAYEHQVPLICNEWGGYPKSAKIEDLNAYFKTMGEIFREMDISWQVWFGIMDAEGKLLPGMAEALELK